MMGEVVMSAMAEPNGLITFGTLQDYSSWRTESGDGGGGRGLNDYGPIVLSPLFVFVFCFL